MKAWRLNAPNSIELADMDSQPVGKGCVKIKLKYSAVSASDLLLYSGKIPCDAPLVLGRQGIGMVTEVGEGVKNVIRGDMVAVKPFSACGGCLMCKKGRPSDCENKIVYGFTEDGFLCDFAVVKAEDVYKLPERIDKKSALLLEHIDMAITTINKLNLEHGEHILINGASYLGIIIAQLALSYQAVPIVVDVDKDRLAMAEKYVYYVLDHSSVNVRKKVLSITGGRMSETVVHVPQCGLPFDQILPLASQNGRVAVVGWEDTADINGVNAAPILNKQLTVMGINGSNNNFSAAINMLVNHTVKVDFDNLPEVNFLSADTLFKDLSGAQQKFIFSRVVMD
ncbi:MAG: alcohol dehydrogenase catalytic domain-containing protein [Clostridiales bacterium]|nr:alcohol dehydrogenase catalytic domain-containing protein [Clostridiales bacterium]